MWANACTLLTVISCAFSAPSSFCPDSCKCQPLGYRQEVWCSSLTFLSKPLSSKLVASIVKLNIQDKSITSIDPRLKGLKNLKHLNLSSNRIKYFTATQVPKSVEILDISNNAISYIPTDWNFLPALKRLNISGNPLSCECDALLARDILLFRNKKIVVEEPVVCDFPKVDRGKSWLKVKCNEEFLFGEMQGDESYLGSGSGDFEWSEPVVTDSPPKIEENGPIEEEFIKDNVNLTYASSSTESTIDEGSGGGISDFSFEDTVLGITKNIYEVSTTTEESEDDYDDYSIGDELTTTAPEESRPAIDLFSNRNLARGCVFNCSTPAPLEQSNDTESSPPSVFEGVHILFKDIFNTETTSEGPTAAKANIPKVSKEETGTIELELKNETNVEVVETHKKVDITSVGEVSPSVVKESPKKETESIGKAESTKEKENAVRTQESKQSSSTFIFLGVLLLVMICIIIYAVVRKTSVEKNRRKRSEVAGFDEKPAEEMKLIKTTNVENGKQNGKPETVPLINNQNEAKSHLDDEPEKEKLEKEEPVTPPGTPADEEDVELRQKFNSPLLTPETKRVTIRASEIPDSVPKTPILVTRHKDSDGKIVTTPNLNQRMK